MNNSYNTKAYKHISDDIKVVDGSSWYRIIATTEIMTWLKDQNKEHWHATFECVANLIDIHEELYTILRLKFE